MAMEPWDPFVQAVSLPEAMSRLLQDSIVRPSRGRSGRRRGDGGGLSAEAMLPVDVEESDDSYTIRASLPGVRPDDVQIQIAGNTVTLRGEMQEEREERPDQRVILRERRMGVFARTLALPTPVDADHAEATYDNGELILRLPKAQPARTRRIAVQRTDGQRQADAAGMTQQGMTQNAPSAGAQSGAQSEQDRRDQEQLVAERSDQFPRSLKNAKWVNSPDEHEDHPGQTLATRNHDVIRRWAEERQATPSTVPGSEHDGHVGVLTFDFPGYGGQNLQHISWDDWFQAFDARNLVILFQEHLQDGRPSNFFHLVNSEQQND